MIKRCLLLAAAVLMSVSQLLADVPFRLHRYDSFKAAPVNEQSIIFYGNSITNMHEWWEAFDSDPRVINRGNSGGYTQELIDNAESLIIGHPAKIFVGIGTNDLGTAGLDSPERVANQMRRLITIFKEESPKTEIYIQSILPSNNGLRNNDKTKTTNALIKAVCEELGATYVDLFDAMLGINSKTISYDDLHVTAKGYKIWCDLIAPHVGIDCSYPATFTENNSGLSGSWGMRSTHWSVQEVKPTDVLIIGDEPVHGGEWHELITGVDVKNRGIGWGYGGISLTQWNNSIPAILNVNPTRKAAPKAIILHIGLGETNGTGTPAEISAAYQTVINTIRTYAPAAQTQIIITSQLPQTDAAKNSSRVLPVNEALKALAESNQNTVYADICTPLMNGTTADAKYITANYLYGRGYNKVAQILAPLVGGTAMTDAEFETLYTAIEARTALANAMTTIEALPEGDGPGQYSAEVLAPAKALIADAKKLLAADKTDVAAINALAATLTEAANKVIEQINQPTAWTEANPNLVTLQSFRNAMYATEATGGVAGQATASNSSAWRLIARDGGFDIVNNQTGNYISPSAANNTQIKTTATQPSTPWVFSYAATPGYYIISNGTAQFNQTNPALNNLVYNWGGGANRDDQGCQYIVAPFEEPEPIEQPEPLLTLVDITLDGTAPYRVEDKYAEPVFKATAVTTAIEYTLPSLMSDRIALVGSSDDEADNAHYAFVITTDGKYQYFGYWQNGLQGWYTRNANGSAAGTHKLIIINDPETVGLTHIADNAVTQNISVAATGAYGIMTYGNVACANALTLGGLITASNDNYLPMVGTILSARFYEGVLTTEQINNLEWEGLEATGSVETTAADAPAARGTYDLTGRRMADNTPLAPGIYVIDGVKTAVNR